MGTTHLDLVRANFGRRVDIQGELRQIDEAATTDKRARTEAEQGKVNELRSELTDIDARIAEHLEVEQRSQAIESSVGHMLGAMVDRERGQVNDTRSFGERFADNAEWRAWVDSAARGTSPVFELNGAEARAVTNLDTSATSGGAFYQNARLSRVGRSFLDRRTFLVDLLPHIPVDNNSVEIVQDQSPLADMANKAATVAEGAAKPQAGITTAVVTEKVATIAAWANLTRRVARNSATAAAYIEGRLRYSVKRNADAQVVGGDGTGANLTGLLNRSGIVTYAPGAAEARAISIRHTLRLMEDVESVPEIIVLAPADAELFDLTNSAANGLHAVPNLNDGPSRSAWGLTQVHSTALTAGTALLIDPMAVAILDADAIRAYMTDSHASNFVSNILTLLLEEDLGLGVFDPAGVAKVTFNGTT